MSLSVGLSATRSAGAVNFASCGGIPPTLEWLHYVCVRRSRRSAAELRGPTVAIVVILYLAVIVAVIAGTWQAFAKAGAPGWAAIIPIYNIYIMTKMGGKPGWWVILMFIPIVNIIMFIILCMPIARNFGKSDGFGVGLALLSFIFWPILGFGDARWQAAPVQ